MEISVFPTRGNLIFNKGFLSLSEQGYELLDKKRAVLLRELMELNEKAKEIQKEIDRTFAEAYLALQKANIDLGISTVERLSYGMPREGTVRIRARSVMGVEIPIVSFENNGGGMPGYGFGSTSSALDRAVFVFNRVKELIIQLSMIENAAYRLAAAIKKTQRRANALKNITIPKYAGIVKDITEALEEHERDEFTRLKIAKKIVGGASD